MNSFNLFDDIDNPQLPKMTKDDFIQKTRSMLQLIIKEYGNCWENKYHEDDEQNTCSRCGGSCYIEQGGVGDVDCTTCNGTGLDTTRVFDSEQFSEFIEHTIMFGEQPFYELLDCEIIDK